MAVHVPKPHGKKWFNSSEHFIYQSTIIRCANCHIDVTRFKTEQGKSCYWDSKYSDLYIAVHKNANKAYNDENMYYFGSRPTGILKIVIFMF